MLYRNFLFLCTLYRYNLNLSVVVNALTKTVTTGEEMARTECMGYGGQQELLTWGGDGKDYRASLPQDRTIYYC